MIEYMASVSGRNLRIAMGLVLIVIGLLIVEGSLGLVITVVGLIPLTTGLLDICLLAPFAGKPLSGYEIRHQNTTH